MCPELMATPDPFVNLTTCRYEKGREVGCGAHGAVYLAKLKVLPMPHPCLLGTYAMESSEIRGHQISQPRGVTITPVSASVLRAGHPDDEPWCLVQEAEAWMGFPELWWRELQDPDEDGSDTKEDDACNDGFALAWDENMTPEAYSMAIAQALSTSAGAQFGYPQEQSGANVSMTREGTNQNLNTLFQRSEQGVESKEHGLSKANILLQLYEQKDSVGAQTAVGEHDVSGFGEEESDRYMPGSESDFFAQHVLNYEKFRIKNRMPEPGQEVAVKKMRINTGVVPGFSRESLRELKALQYVNHPHIVRVYEVYLEQFNIHIVMEALQRDLRTPLMEFARLRKPMPLSHIKVYMAQLLSALAFIHTHGIIHRDVKPENLLLTDGSPGTLKLSDFGTARPFQTPARLSPQTSTLAYRAPELLLGQRHYEKPIDIWGAGCVLAELLMCSGSVLFPGTSEIDQLSHIVSMLGPLKEETWPGVSQFPGSLCFDSDELHTSSLRSVMPPYVDEQAFDLLSRLLVLCPDQRITAEEALQHPFLADVAQTFYPVPNMGATYSP